MPQDVYDRLRAAKNALRKLAGKRVSHLPHSAVRVSCKQGKAWSIWEHTEQMSGPGSAAKALTKLRVFWAC